MDKVLARCSVDRQARNNIIMFNSIITTETQQVTSKMDGNMQEMGPRFDHNPTNNESNKKFTGKMT